MYKFTYKTQQINQKMQQNVQSQQQQQLRNLSHDRNSNPSKLQHSQKLHNEPVLKNQQNECLTWQGIYIDGKYYLADNQAYKKLKDIEKEIQKEKQLILKLKNQEDQDQLEHTEKSYFSIDQDHLRHQQLDITDGKSFDTQTQIDMSRLQKRKVVASKQLQTQEEKYRDNIRKAQLKRTQLKRKLVEDRQIPIKIMDFNQLQQKKKNKQQIVIDNEESIPILTQLKADQVNQIVQKVQSVHIQNLQIIKSQSKHKTISKKQQQIQKSLKVKQKSQEIIQQKQQNNQQKKLILIQKEQSIINNSRLQTQQINGNKSHFVENKSKLSQKLSSHKKYSVKMSSVIVPQSNQTCKQIQQKRQLKSRTSRILSETKKIEQNQIQINNKSEKQIQKSRIQSEKSRNQSSKDYTVKTVSKKVQNQVQEIKTQQIHIQKKSQKSQKRSQKQSQKIVSQKQISQKKISQKPISQKPISQKQISQKPISQKNISQKPLLQKPQKQISQKPISQKHASQKAMVQKAISQNPISQKSRISTNKQQKSLKGQSISSKKSQKIELLYIPNTLKQPETRSFKKTDKSIQWSEIDVSMYGKTINDQSNIVSHNNLLDQSRNTFVQAPKINMRKLKHQDQQLLIEKSEKNTQKKSQKKSQKQSQIQSQKKSQKYSQNKTQKSKIINAQLLSKEISNNSQKKSQKSNKKSFVIRSRQGSVKQKNERYNNHHRDHSLNKKTPSIKQVTLQPIIKQVSTNKAASYRSRKSNPISNISIQQLKTKSLIKASQSPIQRQSQQQLKSIQNYKPSELEISQVLVSKQDIKILHNQIKILEEKLNKIQLIQQNFGKQVKQEHNHLSKQLLIEQKKLQQLQVRLQAQQVKTQKQQQNIDICNQISQQKVDQTQKQQQQIQAQIIQVKHTQSDIIQANSTQQNMKLKQQKVQQEQVLKHIEQQFNKQKINLLAQITRLKHIIRDLQIQKIKSIQHDYTIISHDQQMQHNNTRIQEFGHIVHQSTINRDQHNSRDLNNTINRDSHNTINNLKNTISKDQFNQNMSSRVQNQYREYSRSPIGKIVRNQADKSSSRILQTNESKNFNFRIGIAKKLSITSDTPLVRNLTPTQSKSKDLILQKDQSMHQMLSKRQNSTNPIIVQVDQQFVNSHSQKTLKQLSPLKHKSSDITKQEVLEKFNRTNRQFHNFVESSRIVNQTKSSVSMLQALDRSQQSNRSLVQRKRENADEHNPEKFVSTISKANHRDVEEGSFTRVIQNMRNQSQQQRQQVPMIKIPSLDYPRLPQTPSIQMNQDQLLQLASKVFLLFGITLSPDSLDFSMKKYKNCIILTKSTDTILWNYNGKFYFGGWKNKQNGQGQKTGDGLQIVPAKHVYKGQFLDGKRHGSGVIVMDGVGAYQGQWLKGIKNGQGTHYDHVTKVLYQGEWKDGKKNGYGLLKFSDSQYYQGTFLKSVKDGYGTEVFINGDTYKGQYRKGKFHGKGKYCWANGSSYEGDFNQGIRHGNGSWKSAKQNPDIYVGTYANDKKSGFGRYAWSNGCIYQGSFSEDVKHGKGKLIYNDGKQIKGVWEDGSLIEATSEYKKEKDQEQPLKRSPIKLSFGKV